MKGRYLGMPLRPLCHTATPLFPYLTDIKLDFIDNQVSRPHPCECLHLPLRRLDLLLLLLLLLLLFPHQDVTSQVLVSNGDLAETACPFFGGGEEEIQQTAS